MLIQPFFLLAQADGVSGLPLWLVRVRRFALVRGDVLVPGTAGCPAFAIKMIVTKCQKKQRVRKAVAEYLFEANCISSMAIVLSSSCIFESVISFWNARGCPSLLNNRVHMTET